MCSSARVEQTYASPLQDLVEGFARFYRFEIAHCVMHDRLAGIEHAHVTSSHVVFELPLVLARR